MQINETKTGFKAYRLYLRFCFNGCKLTHLTTSPNSISSLNMKNEVIGRRKSRESVIDMNLSLDSINDFFP